MKRNGVTVEHKYSENAPDKVTGTFYIKDGRRFSSSKIDRRYTYAGLLNAFRKSERYRITPDGKPRFKVASEPPAADRSRTTGAATNGQTEPQKRIVIPPLPKNFLGARIAPHNYGAYERGEVICAGIVKPGDITVTHCWIWYDFKTDQPRCDSAMPRDRYIPDSPVSLKQTEHRVHILRKLQSPCLIHQWTELRWKSKASPVETAFPMISSTSLHSIPA